MSKFVRDLIEYDGLDKYSNRTCVGINTDSFKQTNVDVKFCVPCQKPDMEQIAKVKLTKKVVKSKIIKTPVGTSLEGQVITGYKLMVMGELTLKIMYVADEPEQSMHTFHADIPFCEYVVLPEGFSAYGAATPEFYIEDIYVKQLDERCVFGNVTLMLVADTY